MLAAAERLVLPFVMAADTADLHRAMPIETAETPEPDSKSGAPLEALARTLCGMAPAIEAGVIPADPWIRLLSAAVDPVHPGYLGKTSARRILVESAFLALALRRAPEKIWGNLTAPAKANLLTLLRRGRETAPYRNNWVLFPAMVEAFFHQVEEPWQHGPVENAVNLMMEWYRGDGIYGDGEKVSADYYNSFVIHPMLLEIATEFAGDLPVCAETLTAIRRRAKRHGEILERMIASDGSFPPLGRSLSYRCGAFHLLAHLALTDLRPGALKLGQMRSALMAVIQRTLGHSGNYRADGWLHIGLDGAQPGLAESYINTGSLYLCATAFLPLGLPAAHRFWTAPPMPYTQQRIWTRREDVPNDVALEKR